MKASLCACALMALSASLASADPQTQAPATPSQTAEADVVKPDSKPGDGKVITPDTDEGKEGDKDGPEDPASAPGKLKFTTQVNAVAEKLPGEKMTYLLTGGHHFSFLNRDGKERRVLKIEWEVEKPERTDAGNLDFFHNVSLSFTTLEKELKNHPASYVSFGTAKYSRDTGRNMESDMEFNVLGFTKSVALFDHARILEKLKLDIEAEGHVESLGVRRMHVTGEQPVLAATLLAGDGSLNVTREIGKGWEVEGGPIFEGDASAGPRAYRGSVFGNTAYGVGGALTHSIGKMRLVFSANKTWANWRGIGPVDAQGFEGALNEAPLTFGVSLLAARESDVSKWQKRQELKRMRRPRVYR